MNTLESQMVDLLQLGKEKYGILGVKAEFEAEGTRTDELLRLVEIARKAGVKIGLKVGGCEAMRDLLESKQIGVDYIIAPMVESAYALSKFIDARNKVYGQNEEQVRFLFNVETEQAFNQLDALMHTAKTHAGGVNGIVFGRVDFTLSRRMGRDDINNEEITKAVIRTAEACKRHAMELVVGGGVALEALPALRVINKTFLSRFETRKIIFSPAKLEQPVMEQALEDAVQFELLWLRNKQNYYTAIQQEDAKRIQMLDKRMQELNTRNAARKEKVA